MPDDASFWSVTSLPVFWPLASGLGSAAWDKRLQEPASLEGYNNQHYDRAFHCLLLFRSSALSVEAPLILLRRSDWHHKGPRPAIPARNDLNGNLRAAGNRSECERGALLYANSGRASGPAIYWRHGRPWETSLVLPYAWVADLRLAGGDGLDLAVELAGMASVAQGLRRPGRRGGRGRRAGGDAALVAVAGVGVALAVMLLWWLAALVFRWRFQFSLRSLLMLTLAVALPCSWLAVEAKRAKEQYKVLRGPQVVYEWQISAPGVLRPNATQPGPHWLRQLLGNDFFQDAFWVKVSNDGEIEQVKRLSRLQELSANGARLDDAAMAHISTLVELRDLRGKHGCLRIDRDRSGRAYTKPESLGIQQRLDRRAGGFGCQTLVR